MWDARYWQNFEVWRSSVFDVSPFYNSGVALPEFFSSFLVQYFSGSLGEDRFMWALAEGEQDVFGGPRWPTIDRATRFRVACEERVSWMAQGKRTGPHEAVLTYCLFKWAN